MERFILNTQILIGDTHAADLFSRYARVFLVTDRMMTESGKTAYVTAHLDRYGSTYLIFDSVTPDPALDMVCLLYTSPSPRD